jgi:hypothetical protein
LEHQGRFDDAITAGGKVQARLPSDLYYMCRGNVDQSDCICIQSSNTARLQLELKNTLMSVGCEVQWMKQQNWQQAIILSTHITRR